MQPKVMTANRLLDGEVVYLAADGLWSEWLQDSGAAESDAEVEALAAQADAAVGAQLVVGPYLMPVSLEDGAILPVSQRERIRAKGPSIRTDLGKQAS